MNATENYGLKKPEKNEYISVDIINENMDAVDKTMKDQDNKKVDSTGGDTAETVISAFETSSEEFPVPAAKEKAKTSWGKVKKFGEDFKAWMTGVCLLGHIVNNCVTNNPNLPLSAAQGKALMDLYTVLNTKLEGTQRYKLIDLKGADLITLPAGRWCVSNGLANYELGNWFCEVIEYDDAYKTFTACSYEKDKKYFYRGRKVLHEWLGWEKYTPVS